MAFQKIGQSLKAKIDADYLWNGRKVWLVDGSSCSMPDTPELQETFGQPDGQFKGCGFPVAKIVALFCLASGAIIDIAIGVYRSSELTLWRKLWENLNCGDIILAERFFLHLCRYISIA